MNLQLIMLEYIHIDLLIIMHNNNFVVMYTFITIYDSKIKYYSHNFQRTQKSTRSHEESLIMYLEQQYFQSLSPDQAHIKKQTIKKLIQLFFLKVRKVKI